MSDRVFFSMIGLAAGLMIALALVWPQGIGARSPGPFGHAPVKQGTAQVRPKGPPPVLSMAPDLSSGPSK